MIGALQHNTTNSPIRFSTMSSRPVLASTHPPRAMAAGPPRCPCGLHLLAQLKKAETCATWATREGISWSRGLAYFHVCHTCHNAHWRAYVRGHKSNRHTRPRDADPMAGATKRKATGDLFYLTALAPEFLSAVVRQQAKRFRAIAGTAEDPRASGFPVFCVASVHKPSASTGGLLRPRRVGQRPPSQHSLTFLDGLGC